DKAMVRIRGRRVPEILEVSIDNERFAISSSAIENHFPSLWNNSKEDVRKGLLYPEGNLYSTTSRDRDVLILLFQILENHDKREMIHPSDCNALMDLRWITNFSNHPSERAQIFRSLAKLLRNEYLGCDTDMAYQMSEDLLENLTEVMIMGPGLWLEYVLALDFVWRSLTPNFMRAILEAVVAYEIDPLELEDFWKRAKLPLQETMMSILGYPPELESDLDFLYSDYTGRRGSRRHRPRGQRPLGPIPELYGPRAIHVNQGYHGALQHLNRHQRHPGGGYHQVASPYGNYSQRPKAVLP
ncbi:MAG: hypothetical protein Q9214_001938, partial [Letrouitia sp. 1 TL-2023]